MKLNIDSKTLSLGALILAVCATVADHVSKEREYQEATQQYCEKHVPALVHAEMQRQQAQNQNQNN